jgi:glycosyltransferase involved in cell wall biosynthesis
VIIPARDSASTLERTLEAVAHQEFEGTYEVIVVDDGSRDKTAEIARRYEPLVTLISGEGCGGAGAARNQGARASHASVLAFTDADCLPTPQWLARGLQQLEDVGLVQGRVRPDPAVDRTPFDRSLSVDGDNGFYQTANLLVRRSVFDDAGGFRDWALERKPWWRLSNNGRASGRTERPIGEDTLFGWTARRQGARSAFAQDAVVHHVVLPGSLHGAIVDRWNWTTKMPGLAWFVPELRKQTFYGRWFFSKRTAQFDLAVAAVIAAGLCRRTRLLLAALPYAHHILDEAASYPRRDEPRATAMRRRATHLLGAPVLDLVSLAGFLAGSLEWRSLLL